MIILKINNFLRSERIFFHKNFYLRFLLKNYDEKTDFAKIDIFR